MYAVVGAVAIFIAVNILYLFPVKIFEIYRLVKRTLVYIYNKVKLFFKTKISALKRNAKGSTKTRDPSILSDVHLNRQSIQVVPKKYHKYLERKNKKLNKNVINEFSFRNNVQQVTFDINEEVKVPQIQGITHMLLLNLLLVF